MLNLGKKIKCSVAFTISYFMKVPPVTLNTSLLKASKFNSVGIQYFQKGFFTYTSFASAPVLTCKDFIVQIRQPNNAIFSVNI